MMAKKLVVDDGFLAILAATSPAAQLLIEELRLSHKRRGRPAASESQYRRLELWWKRFRRTNGQLTEEQAAKKFLRLRGVAIANELGLKRSTFHSLRMAVLRGEGESKRLRSHRAAQWQIVPTGLAEKILTGKDHRIVTDANEAVMLRASVRYALLGK